MTVFKVRANIGVRAGMRPRAARPRAIDRPRRSRAKLASRFTARERNSARVSRARGEPRSIDRARGRRDDDTALSRAHYERWLGMMLGLNHRRMGALSHATRLFTHRAKTAATDARAPPSPSRDARAALERPRRARRSIERATSMSRAAQAAAQAAARNRARVVLEHIEKADGGDGDDDGDDARGAEGARADAPGKRRRSGASEDAEGGERDEDGDARGRAGAGRGDGASSSNASRREGARTGVTEDELATMLGQEMSVEERAEGINTLLREKKIDVFGRGGGVVYARVREAQAAKFKGLSTEDMLVYQIIQHAGNAGMWTKELKQRSNLPVPQITKIFKTLEARKLIKSVKHVAQQNRKVYMLYELEPSREITGGAWYTEQEYDAEFISVLREQCVKFIYSRERVTLKEVSDFVRASELSRIDLGQDEVLQIVNTLVYDGKVDEIKDESQDDGMGKADEDFQPITFYTRAALPVPESNAYTDIPCGVCPVINECRPDGLINPSSCEYMTAWLNF